MFGIVGSALIAGLGFSGTKAAADSFSVSVHTPGVSVGYSNHHGHDSGYVSVYQPAPRPVVVYSPPAPVYCPPPVVVHRPVHVCRYDSRPVTRYYRDDCGRRVYYTEYVRVRTCDDYHYARGNERFRDHDDHHHGRHDHDGRGHGKHDRDHYARDWDRDRDHDRHDRHGRDGD